jgi:hypothetical protein
MKPCCIGCLDRDNNEYIEVYESDEIYYGGSREPLAVIKVTSITYPRNHLVETQLANAVRRLLNQHGLS